jgi:predicted transglutaminase-like cysteine proteinase
MLARTLSTIMRRISESFPVPALTGRRLAAFLLAGLIALSALVQAQSRSELGFTTKVSQSLIGQLAQQFSAAARELLGRWIDFGSTQKTLPFMQKLDAAKGKEAEVLQTVNDQINRVPYKTDKVHWGQDDYWATPVESVASNGGDCEDYAISKYYMLKELGVPLERLRITYVKALKLNEAHMVLVYYPRPDAEPYILDNLDPAVKLASLRNDLLPVYSFNDDEVILVQGKVKGKPAQIRQWLSVQERLLDQSKR